MEILFLKEVDSTHTYLKNYIKNNSFTKPIAIVTNNQTNGIGSRDNTWEGKNGNLFLSFVIHKDMLPSDLPIQSASIYFSFLLKEVLSYDNSSIWLKWPNDFYIEDKKIGGTITNLSGNLLYCGIGLNLKHVQTEFGFLDIDFDMDKHLNRYFDIIAKNVSWKHIFSKYSLEFIKSCQLKTTVNNQKISLEKAILNDDGSIYIDNKKVFSLR